MSPALFVLGAFLCLLWAHRERLPGVLPPAHALEPVFAPDSPTAVERRIAATASLDLAVARFVNERFAASVARRFPGAATMTTAFDDILLHAQQDLRGQPDVLAELIAILGAGRLDCGDYAGAEPLLRAGLAGQTRFLGAGGRGTLASEVRLLRLLVRTGRVGEARSHLRDVLDRCRTQLGEQDPISLDAQNLSTAFEIERFRDPRDGERLAWNVLALVRSAPEVPPATHAVALGNVARASALAHDDDDAARCGASAIAIATNAFGPFHPLTLELGRQLASARNLAGERGAADAESVLRGVLAVQVARFGPAHPDLLPTLQELSRSLRTAKRAAEAWEVGRTLLGVASGMPGADPAVRLHARAEIGSDFILADSLEEAEAIVSHAYQDAPAALSPRDPDFCRIQDDWFYILVKQRRFVEAEQVARATITTRRRVFGETSPMTTGYFTRLARVLCLAERPSDAMEIACAGYESAHAREGKDDQLSIDLEQQRVFALQMLGRSAEVMSLMLELVDRSHDALGDAHPTTQSLVANLKFLRSRQSPQVESDSTGSARDG